MSVSEFQFLIQVAVQCGSSWYEFQKPGLIITGMVASSMVFRVNVANKQISQLILDDISGTESNSGAIFEVSESVRLFHNVSEGQRVSHNRSQSISKHFVASKSCLLYTSDAADE